MKEIFLRLEYLGAEVYFTDKLATSCQHYADQFSRQEISLTH
jgi:hypothetical protein